MIEYRMQFAHIADIGDIGLRCQIYNELLGANTVTLLTCDAQRGNRVICRAKRYRHPFAYCTRAYFFPRRYTATSKFRVNSRERERERERGGGRLKAVSGKKIAELNDKAEHRRDRRSIVSR